MLDDLKYIHQRDKSDALGVAAKQWQQLLQQYELHIEQKNITNVVIAGMGGSALAASYLGSWPGLAVPYEIVRAYDVPKYITNTTLFIASSYSGNTEETLSALEKAQALDATIAVISAGGQLADIAKKNDYTFLQLPEGMQPRMAMLSNLNALIHLLSAYGVVGAKAVEELQQTTEALQASIQQWVADQPSSTNKAKQIALELLGKSPVVYASNVLFPAAYKWKISFNENAKNVAWCNQLPEFNHNEFLGWSSHPVDKPYAPIFIQSANDHPQITKRFEVSARLLSGKMPAPIIVQTAGSTLLEELLWTTILGDFVSIYLALLNNVDPTPVDLIEKLKQELA